MCRPRPDGLLRVEEGSLYPALHRMEKEKLIKGEWRTTENGRWARFYESHRLPGDISSLEDAGE